MGVSWAYVCGLLLGLLQLLLRVLQGLGVFVQLILHALQLLLEAQELLLQLGDDTEEEERQETKRNKPKHKGLEEYRSQSIISKISKLSKLARHFNDRC